MFGLSSRMESLVNRETAQPALAYLYANNTQRSYLVGLGSGITAMGTAELFDNAEIVDLNPSMLRVSEEAFADYNYNVVHQSNVAIRFQDGIIDLKSQAHGYDAIINTASSPLYLSASKLYSAEFYQLVRQKLNDGGVYVGWMDTRLGEKGILSNAKHAVIGILGLPFLCPHHRLPPVRLRNLRSTTKI